MLKDNNILNHSFWETQSYLKNIDVVIIGSGIVGLNAAISYLEINKNGKVVVLERGIFPTGASTKNAGFACFGSVSELISDIKNSSENQNANVQVAKGKHLKREELSHTNSLTRKLNTPTKFFLKFLWDCVNFCLQSRNLSFQVIFILNLDIKFVC